jgi:hypothetical protein
MDSKEIHSSPNPCLINLAVEDLIADSQINTDLLKVQGNDLPHQNTSTSASSDQNLQSSEKLNFTHKKNLGNLDLVKMKDNEEIFKKMKDLIEETNSIRKFLQWKFFTKRKYRNFLRRSIRKELLCSGCIIGPIIRPDIPSKIQSGYSSIIFRISNSRPKKF